MCYGSSEFDPEMTDEEIEEAEQAERDYWEEAELDYCQQRFKSSALLGVRTFSWTDFMPLTPDVDDTRRDSLLQGIT